MFVSDYILSQMYHIIWEKLRCVQNNSSHHAIFPKKGADKDARSHFYEPDDQLKYCT